jgi:hypothetical protein
MLNIRPVEVVGFDMQKIPKDRQDRPRIDGLEPVLGDLDYLTVASSFCILVLPIFLPKDRRLWPVQFQVR